MKIQRRFYNFPVTAKLIPCFLFSEFACPRHGNRHCRTATDPIPPPRIAIFPEKSRKSGKVLPQTSSPQTAPRTRKSPKSSGPYFVVPILFWGGAQASDHRECNNCVNVFSLSGRWRMLQRLESFQMEVHCADVWRLHAGWKPQLVRLHSQSATSSAGPANPTRFPKHQKA